MSGSVIDWSKQKSSSGASYGSYRDPVTGVVYQRPQHFADGTVGASKVLYSPGTSAATNAIPQSGFNNEYGTLYTDNGRLYQSQFGSDMDIGGMNATQFASWAKDNPGLAQQARAGGLAFDDKGVGNMQGYGNSTDMSTKDMIDAGYMGTQAVLGLANYLESKKMNKKLGTMYDQQIANNDREMKKAASRTDQLHNLKLA